METKAYLAPPIFSSSKIFLSYTSKQYIPVDDITYNALPDRQDCSKDVKNPLSAYHGWLNKYTDHDALYDAFLETRNALMKGKKVDVSAAALVEKDLVKKKPNIKQPKSRIAKKVKDLPNPEIEPLVTVQVKQDTTSVPSAKDCEPETIDVSEDKKFVIDETLSAADLPQDEISNVFTQLMVLDWCEKDEGIRNRNTLFRMTKENIAKCFPIMIRLANDLYVAISATTGALAGFTVEERYNFLFHVIAKGEMMYYQTVDDPEFCLYMLEQYQPLYTYMRKEMKAMKK